MVLNACNRRRFVFDGSAAERSSCVHRGCSCAPLLLTRPVAACRTLWTSPLALHFHRLTHARDFFRCSSETNAAAVVAALGRTRERETRESSTGPQVAVNGYFYYLLSSRVRVFVSCGLRRRSINRPRFCHQCIL